MDKNILLVGCLELGICFRMLGICGGLLGSIHEEVLGLPLKEYPKPSQTFLNLPKRTFKGPLGVYTCGDSLDFLGCPIESLYPLYTTQYIQLPHRNPYCTVAGGPGPVFEVLNWGCMY